MQKLAIEYLQETQNQFPKKTAIVYGGQHITFRELWNSSLALAYWINTEFQITNQPISVNFPKSIDAVIGLLAIQLSGNIYVPLVIGTPANRKVQILETLGSDYLLEPVADGFGLGGKTFFNNHERPPEIEKYVLDKLSK